jgi:hypothetical protein
MSEAEELKKQNEKLMEQIKTLSIRLSQGSSGFDPELAFFKYLSLRKKMYFSFSHSLHT